MTDEDNSQNEIGHWTNSGIRVALQSWLWVQVEITAIANSNQSFLFKFQIYIFKYINQPETGIDCYVIRNYYSKPWWIQFHFLKMLWCTMQCTITLSYVKYRLQNNILNQWNGVWENCHIISVVLTSVNNFSWATCKKMSSKLSSWISR